MAKQDSKSFFSEWLEKLQQESWQLELLISGLALFGIYESQDLLQELNIYIGGNSTGFARTTQFFFLEILNVGWKIFFINLLIHVILRGLWIGAIGLRYVSQDIDYESLNYSQHFTKMLKRRVGGFDDFIEKLEKICSVLFAYTFLLFLLFFSFSFFFFQLILLAKLSDELIGKQALIIVILLIFYFLIGLIVFIDFITLGIFKKIEEKSISRIYGYIFTFYGWTTMTFLYRPLLYNFLDNRYTKRLFYFSIPYILIILFSANMFSNNNFIYYPTSENDQQFGYTINRFCYDDLRKEYLSEYTLSKNDRRHDIPDVVLNKYMNDDDYLSIFLKMHPGDYKSIQKNTDIEPYWKSGFNFTLFSSETNTDKFYKLGNEKLQIEFDSLRTIRRKLRATKRKTKDSLLIKGVNDQIDSISDYLAIKREAFVKKGIAFEEEKQKKTINAFLDLMTIEINENNAKPLMDCYFFQHPNNSQKGLMCVYPMDSLNFGKQLLHVKKRRSPGTGKSSKGTDVLLPFYKVHNND